MMKKTAKRLGNYLKKYRKRSILTFRDGKTCLPLTFPGSIIFFGIIIISIIPSDYSNKPEISISVD